MKILLTGATGLLGQVLLGTRPNSYIVIPTFNRVALSHPHAIHLDITNADEVNAVVTTVSPDVVIHTSSLGNLDACEKHPRLAQRINIGGTRYLLEAAKRRQAKFIFFSSNAVFDGHHGPYREDAILRPLNVYGRTKVAGEQLVTSAYLPNSIIFRLNTMYGWHHRQERLNPATWLIERLGKKQKTPVVTDIFNNHLWVEQAARAVWKALELGTFGEIFHIAGGECVSRFEFAKMLSHVFGFEQKLLIPVTSDKFAYLAPRARNTCFVVTKMVKYLHIPPLSLIKGLREMKKTYLVTNET